MDSTGNESRLGKSVSVEAINTCHFDFTMASNDLNPLKTAQSIDRVDLASSRATPESPQLQQAQSMDAVNKPGLRRNFFGFEDKWISHINSLNDMEFGNDDADTWSQVSFGSGSVASNTPMGRRHSADVEMFHPPLTRRHSAGLLLGTEKVEQPLKNAARKGLSNSMILNWLTHKRYVPAGEPISEGLGEETTPPQSQAPSQAAVPTSVSLTKPIIPNTGAITEAAQTMIKADNKKTMAADPEVNKKKYKVNYRELNAVSPSMW